MRTLAIAALGVLLAGPAYSQGMNLMGVEPRKDHAAEQKREEAERAYKNATQKIPDQKALANDPWGNVRGTAEAKPAIVKPAGKPRASTRQP